MIESILFLALSIFILYLGAELSLNSSEKVGIRIGLSPLMVGMVLIGFGTSLPEFFVAHIAASKGSYNMAVGSLVGSNIANLFLVLGFCGFLTKLKVSTHSMKKHLLVHLVLSFGILAVLTRTNFNLLFTSPLILICVIYLLIIYKEIKSDKSSQEIEVDRSGSMLLLILQMLAGFVLLYLGGTLIVDSGSKLCIHLGISEYIVSAIFVAFGTSFPELVTAVLAAIKKKDTDMIVGNIVGSNVFNCAFILASLGIYKFPIENDFRIEGGVLIFGSLFLFLLSLQKRDFFLKSGVLFLIAYLAVILKWTNII